MEIKDLLKIKTEKELSKAKNERGSTIELFVKEINKERLGTRFRSVTGQQIAVKLSHLKSQEELYWFLGECKKGSSFGKVFFGALKVHKKS